MNNGLHVSTEAMNKDGKDTVTNSDSFDEELKSLAANVEGLRNIWHGLSSDNFNKSYEDQAKNLQQFRELLNDLGEAIQAGAGILNRTEEENASAGAHLF